MKLHALSRKFTPHDPYHAYHPYQLVNRASMEGCNDSHQSKERKDGNGRMIRSFWTGQILYFVHEIQRNIFSP
jgi:hypothetical protein